MDKFMMCVVLLLVKLPGIWRCCSRFCSCDNIFLVRLSSIVPNALLSPLVISLLCLQLSTPILGRISFIRFFIIYLFILWAWGRWERGVLSQLLPPYISCFAFVFCVHSFWDDFSSVIFNGIVSMFLYSNPFLLSWSNRRFIWFFCVV